MELHYAEYGNDGPPLIILHGLLGAHGNWHTLSRTRFSEHSHVFAVDQRNHGESPHADQFDYDVMAEDTRAFIDRLNAGSGTLLGHSMGGKTAMQTALQYGSAVDRLIVVDMAPRSYPPLHKPIIDALQEIDPTTYEDRSAIDEALAKDVPSFAVRQFLLKNLRYDTGDGKYRWKMNLSVIANNYDRVNEAVRSDEPFESRRCSFAARTRPTYRTTTWIGSEHCFRRPNSSRLKVRATGCTQTARTNSRIPWTTFFHPPDSITGITSVS